jgi:shikimate kinase
MQKIILLGFMGSGKSTLGRNLAHRLGVPFVDTDHEIELLKDRTVEQIFQEEGESVFREHERQIIEVLSAIDTDFVLAVGGGLPCYNNLIEKLNMLGITVYLNSLFRKN